MDRANSGIAVIGAGSWGTALAILLARNGHTTILWGRYAQRIAEMREAGENARFLPDCPFPENHLALEADLQTAVRGAQDVVLAVPSHAFRAVLEMAAPYLEADVGVAWATKGLEPSSGRLLHQVAEDVLGNGTALAVLSGPTFAREVAAGRPAAVTIDAHDEDFGARLSALFHSNRFRTYTSTDMVGVQIGGAVKNVLAIAAGIADGLKFGANTRAALITRGLAELSRLGQEMGGQAETFMGLAGLGDLVLTCTDDQSRNRRLGLALARGQGLDEALKEIGQVAEGVAAAGEVMRLAHSHGVEMPICEQVHRVVSEDLSPLAAVEALITRAPGSETR